MKKTTICTFAIIAIAAVGCTKNEPLRTAEPVADNGIVLYANDANLTKTVTDPDKFTVKWAEGDSLAVFTWKHGETEPADAASWWVGNSVRFRISDVENGKFNLITECASTNKEYPQKLAEFKERYNEGKTDLDWYVIYPGNMYTPSRPLMMITVLGKNMVQNGKDNLDHLSSLDVMFGKAEGTTKPDVKMHHLGTLMEFTVTNGTADAIDVKSITVDAGDEVIGGEFRTELNGNPVEVKKDSEHINGGTKPLTTCELKVNNVSLKPGEPGKFYMILAPFKIAKGNSVSITVLTDKGACTINKTAEEKDIVFKAGEKSTASILAVIEEDKGITTKEGVKMGLQHPQHPYPTFLSLMDGSCYVEADGKANCDNIDIVSFQGRGGITLASPSYQYITSKYSQISEWGTRHKTLFSVVENMSEEEFNNIQSATEIINAFNTSKNSDYIDGLNKAAIGKIIAVKTFDNHYAIIRYTSQGAYDGTENIWKNEYMEITVKFENR